MVLMRSAWLVLLSLLVVTVSGQGVLLWGRQQTTSSGGTRPSATSSIFLPPSASPAPSINSSDYDLSQHYCRLYRHASTLPRPSAHRALNQSANTGYLGVYADGKIYIDGGNAFFPKNGRTTFSNTSSSDWIKGMNNNLLVLDLSKNFTNQDSFPYSAIHKGSDVPNSLIEHALWYSGITRKIYQVGGWFSSNERTDPGFKNTSLIPDSSIWQFDIDSQVWSIADDFALVDTGSKIDRPGAAAYCDAPSLNMSFIFEGYVQARSDKLYSNFTPASEYKFLEGMLALDTSKDVSKPTLTNISVPAQMLGQDFGPRMNGASVHVPVGEKGVVVQLGGQIPENTTITPYGTRIKDANAHNVNIPLRYVDIYDIQTGYWFRQETFGLTDGIPYGRSDICTVMVPAKDGSSFNIYMVAGVDTYASFITVEEIWVLTLPTFQWVLVHTRADGMYGHTCHVVGENLVIVGGMQTKPEGGDVNTCATHMPAEIFSLVTQEYTGFFDADGAKRAAPVPAKVVAAIGGTTAGGAYITTPKVWSDLYLQYIFNPTLTRPSYTPTYILANGTSNNGNSTTPPSTPKSKSNKAVIGGAVGGVLGGLLVIGLIACICLRRRGTRRAKENRQSHQGTITSELPAPAYSPGMSVKHDFYHHHTDHAQEMPIPVHTPAQTEPAELYDHNHAYPYPPDTPEIDGAETGMVAVPTSRFNNGHGQHHRRTVSDGTGSEPGTALRDWTISPASQTGGFDELGHRRLTVSDAEGSPTLGRRME